jgi:hypothetical protein
MGDGPRECATEEGDDLMAILLEEVRRVQRISMKEHASAASSANYGELVIEESELRIMLLEQTWRLQT